MRTIKNIFWLAKNREAIEKMLNESNKKEQKSSKKVAFGMLTESQQDYVNKVLGNKDK